MKNEDLTREKLQSIEQSELVEMYLSQQEELQRLQKITDLLSEEVKNLKAVRFGRSTEKDPQKKALRKERCRSVGISCRSDRT